MVNIFKPLEGSFAGLIFGVLALSYTIEAVAVAVSLVIKKRKDENNVTC